MAEPSSAVALFGTDEPVPDVHVLRAGALEALLDAGNLRYIRVGGEEAIRAIAFVARSATWGTYTPEILDLEIEQNEGAFRVRYTAVCEDASQSLRYRARIDGSADGAVRFEADVEPLSDWTTMRTGFVVLHGVEGVAGEPALVEHTDGRPESSTFPALIKPSQPFFDIRAIVHRVGAGIEVRCTMHGDAYEMEDQRNWSDASYKTYIRPLAKRPAPYTLAAGESTSQSVVLETRGAGASDTAGAGAVSVAVGEATGERLPEIGLAVAPEWAAAALEQAEIVRAARPRYLVCRHDPTSGHGVAELSRMAALGEALDAEPWLELVVPCRAPDGTYTDSAEILAADLDAASRAVREARFEPAAVVACPHAYLKSYQPDWEWPKVPPLESFYGAVRERFPGARIGGGMHAYFTELNRKPPPPAAIDFITHSTSPIVHAADDLTVMESLESLPSIMRSARALADGRAYCIGPSAIGMRMNPYGEAPAETSGSTRVAMARIDPRQRGLLNAAWTLGYVAHAARHGVAALALSAPVGEHGIAYRRTDWAQPWFDEPGGHASVYPVYHVVRGLAEASGARVREVACSAPARVQGVAWETAGGLTVWLANLGAEAVDVSLEIPGLARGAVLALDQARFESLCSEPALLEDPGETLALDRLALGPHAVARVVAA